MVAGITMLLAKIAAAITWFGLLFVAVFVAIWDLAKDAFSWAFEQFMDVGISAVGSFDTSGLDASVSWGSLPAEMLNILALIGLAEVSAIIVAALGIRLALQLVPFTRLGS